AIKSDHKRSLFHIYFNWLPLKILYMRVAWHRAVFEADVSIDFCRRRGLVELSEKGQHEVFSDDPVAIKCTDLVIT
ncbi:hypothetical protein, partial [Aeromonas veronii]|uniref:hypothetical protein n=1 Tax=Aeromonas veronii TaxID=654 RepID=UPI003D06A607